MIYLLVDDDGVKDCREMNHRAAVRKNRVFSDEKSERYWIAFCEWFVYNGYHVTPKARKLISEELKAANSAIVIDHKAANNAADIDHKAANNTPPLD